MTVCLISHHVFGARVAVEAEQPQTVAHGNQSSCRVDVEGVHPGFLRLLGAPHTCKHRSLSGLRG